LTSNGSFISRYSTAVRQAEAADAVKDEQIVPDVRFPVDSRDFVAGAPQRELFPEREARDATIASPGSRTAWRSGSSSVSRFSRRNGWSAQAAPT
jgi:hypothetical protein